MFILYKVKNKLDIATWSLKELLLQIKGVESPGQVKQVQTKPEKPQSLQTLCRVCGLLLGVAVLNLLKSLEDHI